MLRNAMFFRPLGSPRRGAVIAPSDAPSDAVPSMSRSSPLADTRLLGIALIDTVVLGRASVLGRSSLETRAQYLRLAEA